MIKKTTLAVIAVLMVLLSVFQVFSATIYIVDGYSYNILTNTTIAICGWDNSSPELIIPDQIAGRRVTAIANEALCGNEEITSIDFSNTTQLTTIGYDAFSGCSALQGEIVIPETVTSIGRGAFRSCPLLESADIRAKVSNISEQAFYGCSELTSVKLSDSVTVIEKYAFADCPKLTSVEIPATVETIYKTSFKNDHNLTLGVWYGTAGYDYAVAQNIPFVILDGVKLGDTDGDGCVNINDVTHIQRHLAELESLEGIYLHVADANQDGTLDISDATTLQMYLAEYDIPYPIDEIMTQ